MTTSVKTRTGMLEIRGISVSFGGVHALSEVDLDVHAGTIHGLVGPNGSGKTTMINAISGHVAPASGVVMLGGQDISRWPASARARAGLARSFQDPALLADFGARGVLLLGAHLRRTGSWLRRLVPVLGPRADREDEELIRPHLAAHELRIGWQPLRDLPHGVQRMLDVARVEAANPQLLVLDEPAAGLSAQEVAQLADDLREVRRKGVSVLLTDHNLNFMMSLCDDSTVLNFGKVIGHGSPQEVRSDPRVVEAYLGQRRSEPRNSAESVRLADNGSPSALDAEGLTVAYGAHPAVDGVDVRVLRGEVVALVGANGAGKSTTLRTLAGALRPLHGAVRVSGSTMTGSNAASFIKAGVACVPEGRRILGSLTVAENLRMGAFVTSDRALLQKRLGDVFALFPVLEKKKDDPGASLSGGEQQMLAIGRALMSDPQVLLMDEPSLGLAPLMVERVYELIGQLCARGIAVIVADQNAEAAMAAAHHVYVLERGRIVAEGPPDLLLASGALEAAYLGGADATGRENPDPTDVEGESL